MQNPLLTIPAILFTQFTGREASKEEHFEQVADAPEIRNHWLRLERYEIGEDDASITVSLFDNYDEAWKGQVSESLLRIEVRPTKHADHNEMQSGGYVITARVTDKITSYPGYSNVYQVNLLSFLHGPAGAILLAALELIKDALESDPGKDLIPGDQPDSGDE